MNTDKCPHCGAARIPNSLRFLDRVEYVCGSTPELQKARCFERVALKKAEKELAEAAEAYGQKRDADHRASLSDRRANQAETRATLLSVDLEETRRKLEEARRAVRYLFYSRNATGETVSDAMHEMEPERWREIYKILNPDAEKGGAS